LFQEINCINGGEGGSICGPSYYIHTTYYPDKNRVYQSGIQSDPITLRKYENIDKEFFNRFYKTYFTIGVGGLYSGKVIDLSPASLPLHYFENKGYLGEDNEGISIDLKEVDGKVEYGGMGFWPGIVKPDF